MGAFAESFGRRTRELNENTRELLLDVRVCVLQNLYRKE